MVRMPVVLIVEEVDCLIGAGAPLPDPSTVKPPNPQQKQAACQAQYQQSVSAARSTATKQFLGFFTAAGIPGDIGLIGCLGTGELAPVCMEVVELALSAPSIVGMFAFVNQYTATVDAAKSQM
ncbi:MAG: hypothetical protein ACRDHZ_20865 [Ktedonobacteraceae bacterium]